MGPQFIEVEVFARKADKRKKIARTAREVVSEAVRDENHIHHLSDPAAPVLLFGDLPNEVLDVAELTVEGEKDAKGRKVRSDRPILLAGVASFPVAFAEMDDEQRKAYGEWKKLTLAFLKAEYGDSLASVVEHTDEPRGHLHFYAVNFAKVSETRDLHPGHRAAKGHEGAEGMVAYKKGCSDFQDRYFAAVSVPIGLTRTGPKRHKLTRTEWKEKKAEAEKVADLYQETQAEAEKTRSLWEEVNAAWDEVEAALAEAQAKAKAALKEAVAKGKEKTAELLELLEKKNQECDQTLANVQKKYGLGVFDVAMLDARKDPKPEAVIDEAEKIVDHWKRKASAGGEAPRTPVH